MTNMDNAYIRVYCKKNIFLFSDLLSVSLKFRRNQQKVSGTRTGRKISQMTNLGSLSTTATRKLW